jgi:lysyl-tRNA synthetase class 2
MASASTIPKMYEERRTLLENNSTAPAASQLFPHYERPAMLVKPREISRTTEVGQSATVAGRIQSIRTMGSNLTFFDLYHDGEFVQILVSAAEFPSQQIFEGTLSQLQRGDIVQVHGRIIRNKKNEICLRAAEISSLARCLCNIPSIKSPELTEDHQARWRHLDLLSDPDKVKHHFRLRSHIIREIRIFLADHDFLEVETPILNGQAGGALAKPFCTELTALKMPLVLRIAPELYLKQLIIGGFDCVFELGKVFRNEGLDMKHNPEFTSLEMYQSFASSRDMKKLLHHLLRHLVGKFGPIRVGQEAMDFDQIAEIDIVPTLETTFNVKFNFDDRLAGQCLDILTTHQIKFNPSNRSASYLFDKLIGHALEPQCRGPTFLLNHPLVMSPLAKAHPLQPHLSDRFELFIAGTEIANGYSELNDPIEQRRRFAAQQSERIAGNDETHSMDEDYVEALYAGLPPTAGCGIGIDRLIMLFSNSQHIRNVLLFPLVKPQIDN